jgi:hypothetical protein
MSTRARAWLFGATFGCGGIWLVNHFLISKPQAEMLLELRKALVKPGVISEAEATASPNLGLRQLMNLAVITVSDRLIFRSSTN